MKRDMIARHALFLLAPLLLLPAPVRGEWPALFRGAELYEAGTWTASSTYRGGSAGGIGVGDLNGDGLPDLVVTNLWDQDQFPGRTLAVLLHAPDSGAPSLFQSRTNFPTVSPPVSVALADMNQDGNLDAVIGSQVNSVAVHLGNGAGGLGPPTTYYTGMTDDPWALAVADVNADGLPDVITGNRDFGTPDGISVLLGTGNGNLGPLSIYTIPMSPISTVERLAIHDVTGDGVLDVVAVGSNLGVALLTGNNTGAFTFTAMLPIVTSEGWDVAAGDVDGNGIADIVVADNSSSVASGGVSVLFGTGGGNFLSAVRTPLVRFVWSLELGADADGDGKPEIVAAFFQDYDTRNWVAVLEATGTGTVGPPTYYDAIPAFGDIRLADVDMNGKLDIVVGQSSFGGVSSRVHAASVLRDDGAAGFRSGVWSIPGRKPLSEAMADFNLDGKNDVAFADSASIGIALGNGNGTFTYMLGGNLASPTPGMITTGDWNRDGRPDIAFQHGSNVVGWYGVGTGGFSFTFSISSQVLHQRSVADMNRDGRLDFVLTSSSLPNVLRICTQLLDGTYLANSGVGVSSTVASIAMGDWNRDGIRDVATAMSNGVSVFRGVGNGTFQPEQSVITGRPYRDVCSGDFNRDGKPDLAAIEQTAGQSGTRGITIFLGDGVGGFSLPKTIVTFDQNGGAVESWDANVDGKPDLIATASTDPDYYSTTTPRPAVMEVHLGNGNGGFSSRTTFSLGALTGNLLTGDVNGDDLPDATVGAGALRTLLAIPPDYGYWLGTRSDYPMSASNNRLAVGDLNRDGLFDVVASSSANLVSVRLANGFGMFGPPATVATSLSARQVKLGDVNRDGIVDLVISRSGLGAPDVVSCMLGAGNGTFGPRLDNPTPGVTEFEIADMNRDGFPDLVVGQPNFAGSTVRVLTGNGDGTFTAQTAASVPYVYDLEVVDFDRDGDLDVVVAGGGFYVMYGNGDGTLDNSLFRNVGSTSIQSVCAADFNRDGYPDVALSDITATVRVAWGSSNFTTYVVSAVPISALDLQVGPAEADGRQFLYMSTYDNTVVVLQPTGTPGAFAVVVDQATGGNPEALALADLDGDALLDVVTANSTDGNVSIFVHAQSPVTGIAATPPPAAPAARLDQNYPNPFNPVTTVRYVLKERSRVHLAIFDVQGRKVATLADGWFSAGEHTVRWDGRTEVGTPAASGVYLYRLSTPGFADSRRMVMMR